MSFIEIEKRQRILPCLPSILVMIIKNIIHKLPKTNLVSVFFTSFLVLFNFDTLLFYRIYHSKQVLITVNIMISYFAC